jgi:hypothetical protein
MISVFELTTRDVLAAPGAIVEHVIGGGKDGSSNRSMVMFLQQVPEKRS